MEKNLLVDCKEKYILLTKKSTEFGRYVSVSFSTSEFVHTEKSYLIKPKSDCIYHALIDLEHKRTLPVCCSKSIGVW